MEHLPPTQPVDQLLHETQIRLRNLVEHSIQGILVHTDYRPLFANQALVDLLGYTSAQEIVALPSILTLFAPHERTRLDRLKRDRLAGHAVPTRYEAEVQCKDGQLVPVDVMVSVVQWDGKVAIQGTLVDISERKQAKQALQQSEARFRDYAEAAADWFWEQDAQLRFTFLSPAGLAAMERTSEQALGYTREDIFAAQIAAQPTHWQPLFTAQQQRAAYKDFEYSWQRQDGHTIHVSISGKPIFDSQGVFQGYRGVARDITLQLHKNRTKSAVGPMFIGFFVILGTLF